MRVDCSGDFAMTILRPHSSRIRFYSSVVAATLSFSAGNAFDSVVVRTTVAMCWVKQLTLQYGTSRAGWRDVLRAGWWPLVIALPLKSAPPLFDIKCLISKLEDGQVLCSIASQW